MVWYICLTDAWARDVKCLEEIFLTVGGTQGIGATLDMTVKFTAYPSTATYWVPTVYQALTVLSFPAKGMSHQNGEGQKEVALGFNHVFVYHHISVCV